MNQNPPTDEQLNQIEAKAGELRERLDRKNPWPSDNESHWTAEGWKSGTRNALDKLDPAGLVAEVRRLRDELATARVQAIRDLADKADPQCPEISFFGDHGHEVGAWMRKQAEYEERRAATPASAVAVAGGEQL